MKAFALVSTGRGNVDFYGVKGEIIENPYGQLEIFNSKQRAENRKLGQYGGGHVAGKPSEVIMEVTQVWIEGSKYV
jgi:hypothetical protein